MNMKKNIFCALLLVAVMLFCLYGCVEKPSEESNVGEIQTEKDDFSAAVDDGESSTLGKEYQRCADLAQTKDGFVTADAHLFEYEEIDGGLRITKYKGEYELLSLPDSINGKAVVSIGKEAFAANRWLAAVVLPDSIKNVESLAFYGCTNLCYVDLGDGKKTVENYAFSNCPSLFSIDLTSAESIGKGALFACGSIHDITVSFVGGQPDENTFIGYIFGAETADHNAEFVPESLRRITLSDECKTIPDRAFSNCRYLTEVVIPDSVGSIGVRAFAYCRSIAELDVGKGTEIICDDAFFGCDNLKKITLSESLKSLGMQAFFGCDKLEEINMPATLSEIKPSTFYGCKSLKNIDLTNVKTIGKDAFYGSQILLETADAEK